MSLPPELQVLLNDDILSRIFDDHLSIHGLTGDALVTRRDTLARCACVSRFFLEHAVRNLWFELDQLGPLWYLIAPSGDLRELCSGPFYPSYKAAVMEVSALGGYKNPTMWARFLYYAPYVRSLAIDAYTNEDAVLIHDLRTMLDGPLLPRLRYIKWAPLAESSTRFHTPLCVISPDTTTSLAVTFDGDFDVDGWKKDIARFLRGLRASALALDSLTINTTAALQIAWRGGGPIIPFVLASERIRSLKFDWDLAPSTFRRLVQMPRLELIETWLQDHPDPTCSSTPESTQLKKLGLHGTIEVVSPELTPLRHPLLTSLFICAHGKLGEGNDPTALTFSGVVRFTTLLSRAVSPHLLVYLVIQGSAVAFTPDPGCESNAPPPALDIVQPLLSLPALEVVDLYLGNTPVTLSDADCATIAGAWPRATWLRLYLRTADGEPGLTLPSARALHTFARLCPRLQVLTLPYIHPSLPSTPPAVDYSGIRNHPMWWLHMLPYEGYMSDGPLPAGARRALAEYVDRLFPNLPLTAEQTLRKDALGRMVPLGRGWGTVFTEAFLVREPWRAESVAFETDMVFPFEEVDELPTHDPDHMAE